MAWKTGPLEAGIKKKQQGVSILLLLSKLFSKRLDVNRDILPV